MFISLSIIIQYIVTQKFIISDSLIKKFWNQDARIKTRRVHVNFSWYFLTRRSWLLQFRMRHRRFDLLQGPASSIFRYRKSYPRLGQEGSKKKERSQWHGFRSCNWKPVQSSDCRKACVTVFWAFHQVQVREIINHKGNLANH